MALEGTEDEEVLFAWHVRHCAILVVEAEAGITGVLILVVSVALQALFELLDALELVEDGKLFVVAVQQLRGLVV